MYNAMPVPVQQSHGGLVQGYSHGGQVKGYAMGGQPMLPPAANAAPPMPAANPLALQTAHQIGVKIGQKLRENSTTPDGRVQGHGTGQSDSVPAKLSVDEYIVPADVVSKLGDGSSQAGGKALDVLVANVRKQKAIKGFPPKAKNPLSYLPKTART